MGLCGTICLSCPSDLFYHVFYGDSMCINNKYVSCYILFWVLSNVCVKFRPFLFTRHFCTITSLLISFETTDIKTQAYFIIRSARRPVSSSSSLSGAFAAALSARFGSTPHFTIFTSPSTVPEREPRFSILRSVVAPWVTCRRESEYCGEDRRRQCWDSLIVSQGRAQTAECMFNIC